ncbi:helix-turn-helix domain-containing protein [Timonella senegalensis]|uniref:helix-turn-helix domain-containing protein n=1 Tax=Timonella senegalensis TaxID=1465825 RepID=UPI0028A60C7C|nr:helix-turn-helix transcriptional regulator [Timonella senegalensis]
MKKQTPPGQPLRELRKYAGLTLEDVATRADCAVSYLSKVETGKLTPADSFVARVTTAIADLLTEHIAAA